MNNVTHTKPTEIDEWDAPGEAQQTALAFDHVADAAAEESDASEENVAAATYEFRWDVEAPIEERRYGQKFMKQWKRVLQAQRMGPLVSAKLSPRHARFQLCTSEDTTAPEITACADQIAHELGRLRWTRGTAEANIEGEPPSRHANGWQGVRVWMTFTRQDVETVLGKKARI